MTSAPYRVRTARCRWCDVALLGAGFNLAVLIATPLIRPELDLFRQSLSYYAVGPWGTVQAAGFVALAISSLALAMALGSSEISSPWLPLVIASLVVVSAGSLGLVVYPMGSPGPTTILGDAHQSAGTLGGVAGLVAILSLNLATHTAPGWQRISRIAWLAFGLALTGAVLSQIAIWWPELGIPMGATMRVFVAPLVVLMGIVAWRLRQCCGSLVNRSGAGT